MRILPIALLMFGALVIADWDQCTDCPDPGRPWMRGTVEISCAHPSILEELRKESPNRTIKACACQHTCDPLSEHAGSTDMRGWDYRCEARCNPANCQCPHPCDS